MNHLVLLKNLTYLPVHLTDRSLPESEYETWTGSLQEKNLPLNYSQRNYIMSATSQDHTKQILAESKTITLTSRDWKAFARALDNTDKPRPKLSAAIERYQIWHQGNP